MRNIFYILIFLFFSLSPLRAQFDEVIYDREFTYGITTNTNVFFAGFSFKFSKFLSKEVNHHIGFELSNLKHPKEERYTNIYGNTFIYNKQYFVFPLRANYGREYILFRKTPYEGMQLSLNVAVGPTFALVKPYYVIYDRGDSQRQEPYDPRIHEDENRILDGGGIFRGLDRGRFEFGLHMKNSLAFEFGKFGNDVAGLELGMLIEGYNKNIEILPFAPNNPVFSTLFLTLFYGSRK
ncbi:hypothetical protein HZR84_05680 [Hyphobacterium sp. CCMP332]|nr:hypothetical protein HZR84_05680 [Hyphobacterium sp. CCMP332]